jgi:hypothetical protein
LAVPRGGKGGLWIEMKDEKKPLSSLSKAQMDHLELMVEMGYSAVWAAGFDIAKAAVEAYLCE